MCISWGGRLARQAVKEGDTGAKMCKVLQRECRTNMNQPGTSTSSCSSAIFWSLIRSQPKFKACSGKEDALPRATSWLETLSQKKESDRNVMEGGRRPKNRQSNNQTTSDLAYESYDRSFWGRDCRECSYTSVQLSSGRKDEVYRAVLWYQSCWDERMQVHAVWSVCNILSWFHS